MLSEQDEQGRPIAYNRIAGFVVTGNEDGAHHVINEMSGALLDIGFTIPGQAWTYWNKGPGSGESYLQTDYKSGIANFYRNASYESCNQSNYHPGKLRE